MNWFPGWLDAHIHRHALIGLPQFSQAQEMYTAWRTEFERLSVSEAAAEAASLALMRHPENYKSKHFSLLCGLLDQYSGGVSEPRGVAESHSRDCPYCYGSGRAAVVDSQWQAVHAACCICPAGRFYLAAWAKQFKPLDLHGVLAGATFRVIRRGEPYTVTYRLLDAPRKEQDRAEHLRSGPPGSNGPDARRYRRALPLPQSA